MAEMTNSSGHECSFEQTMQAQLAQLAEMSASPASCSGQSTFIEDCPGYERTGLSEEKLPIFEDDNQGPPPEDLQEEEYDYICVEHVGDTMHFSFGDDGAYMHQAEYDTNDIQEHEPYDTSDLPPQLEVYEQTDWKADSGHEVIDSEQKL